MVREVFNLEEIRTLIGWLKSYWRSASGYHKLEKYFRFEPVMKIATKVETFSDISSEPGLYLIGSDTEQLLICQTPPSASGRKKITLKPSSKFELQPEGKTIEEKALLKTIYIIGPALLILIFLTSPGSFTFRYAITFFFFFMFKAGLRNSRDKTLEDIRSAYDFQQQKLKTEK